MRVAVAMSGGVDSSVAALLLKDAGHEVVGLSMRLFEARSGFGNGSGNGNGNGSGKKCCTPGDLYDAKRVALEIGIPHYVLDYSSVFANEVVLPFCDEYARGRTPSPCVLCNDRLKFRSLLSRTRALGCNALATGHYARVEGAGGRYRLLRGRDNAKDQAYFLFGLGQAELSRALFPLGDLDKGAVRDRARAAGLPVAEKPDSQEVCFLEGDDLGSFLRERGIGAGDGDVVDESGAIRGRHRGAACFTVGQRHGIRVADRHPLYVVSIDVAKNRVTVGPRASLAAHGLVADGVNWISGEPPSADGAVLVQIRSRHEPALAMVEGGDSGASREFRAWFREPVFAVAPGQAAVVSRGDEILGGGWIREAIRRGSQ